MRQAPRAVSEGLGPGSDLNRSVPCLSAVDCTRALTRERKQIPDWQLTESPAPFLYLAFGRRAPQAIRQHRPTRARRPGQRVIRGFHPFTSPRAYTSTRRVCIPFGASVCAGGRMVLEARTSEETRWQVNAHFMTQADGTRGGEPLPAILPDSFLTCRMSYARWHACACPHMCAYPRVPGRHHVCPSARVCSSPRSLWASHHRLPLPGPPR
jgi:hypothetical protein